MISRTSWEVWQKKTSGEKEKGAEGFQPPSGEKGRKLREKKRALSSYLRKGAKRTVSGDSMSG